MVDQALLISCLSLTCAEPGVYVLAGRDWQPAALRLLHECCEAAWRRLARQGREYLKPVMGE